MAQRRIGDAERAVGHATVANDNRSAIQRADGQWPFDDFPGSCERDWRCDLNDQCPFSVPRTELEHFTGYVENTAAAVGFNISFALQRLQYSKGRRLW